MTSMSDDEYLKQLNSGDTGAATAGTPQMSDEDYLNHLNGVSAHNPATPQSDALPNPGILRNIITAPLQAGGWLAGQGAEATEGIAPQVSNWFKGLQLGAHEVAGTSTPQEEQQFTQRAQNAWGDYADIPTAIAHGFNPMMPTVATPEDAGLGHQALSKVAGFAPMVAELGGLQGVQAATGLGGALKAGAGSAVDALTNLMARRGITPLAKNIIMPAVKSAAQGAATEALPFGVYEALANPQEGQTRWDEFGHGVGQGALFGGIGRGMGNVAGAISPTLGSALSKIEGGAALKSLAPEEQAAMTAYGYIHPAVFGAGIGATEPAKDWQERLKNALLSSATFAGMHGASSLLGGEGKPTETEAAGTQTGTPEAANETTVPQTAATEQSPAFDINALPKFDQSTLNKIQSGDKTLDGLNDRQKQRFQGYGLLDEAGDLTDVGKSVFQPTEAENQPHILPAEETTGAEPVNPITGEAKANVGEATQPQAATPENAPFKIPEAPEAQPITPEAAKGLADLGYNEGQIGLMGQDKAEDLIKREVSAPSTEKIERGLKDLGYSDTDRAGMSDGQKYNIFDNAILNRGGVNRGTFIRQHDLEQNHANDTARQRSMDVLKQIGIEPKSEQGQIVLKAMLDTAYRNPRDYDPLTMYQDKIAHALTTERAFQEHLKTGRNFAYGDIDLKNLGGLNTIAGNAKANLHFKNMMSIVKDTIEKSYPKALAFRHGGDEFSVVAPDISKEQLQLILDRAKIKVEQYVKKNGLENLYHPKLHKETGTGIYSGTADFKEGNTFAEVNEKADKRTLEAKNEIKGNEGGIDVRGSETNETGLSTPDRQGLHGGQGLAGVQPENRGGGQGEHGEVLPKVPAQETQAITGEKSPTDVTAGQPTPQDAMIEPPIKENSTLQSAIADVQGNKKWSEITPEQEAALKDAGLMKGKLLSKAERNAIEAMGAPKETDFVKTKDGTTDFGQITPEIGQAIGRQAAPIRLQEGTDKYGKQHIDISDNGKHLKEIKAAGYSSTNDFIQDVANNFNEIRKNIGSRLILIKKNGRDSVAIIELRPSKDGDSYNVVTGGMFRKDYAKNRTLLWERVAPPLVKPESSNSLHAVTPTDTQDVNAKRLSQGNATGSTIAHPPEHVKGKNEAEDAATIAKDKEAMKQQGDKTRLSDAEYSLDYGKLKKEIPKGLEEKTLGLRNPKYTSSVLKLLDGQLFYSSKANHFDAVKEYVNKYGGKEEHVTDGGYLYPGETEVDWPKYSDANVIGAAARAKHYQFSAFANDIKKATGKPMSDKDRADLPARLQKLADDIYGKGSKVSELNIDPEMIADLKAKYGDKVTPDAINGVHRHKIITATLEIMGSRIGLKLEGRSLPNVYKTFYHEIAHALDPFLGKAEHDVLNKTYKGDKEAIADAFGAYAARSEGGLKRFIPRPVRAAFDKMMDVMGKIGNFLKGKGWIDDFTAKAADGTLTSKDVFDRMLESKYKDRAGTGVKWKAGAAYDVGKESPTKDVKTKNEVDADALKPETKLGEPEFSIASKLKDKLGLSTDEDKERALLDEKAKAVFKPLDEAWGGGRQEKEFINKGKAQDLQDEIKALSGEKHYGPKSQEIDRALELYIDAKRNPDDLAKYYPDFNNKQRTEVANMQRWANNPEFQKIAAEIEKSYDQKGDEALAAGVIKNKLEGEGYVNRGKYKDVEGNKQSGGEKSRFGTTTGHAQQRTFGTLFEAWAHGKEQSVEGATNNMRNHHNEIDRVIEDKKLRDVGVKANWQDEVRAPAPTDKDGNPVLDKDGNPVQGKIITPAKKLFTSVKEDGYAKIDHPNFVDWVFSGKLTNEGDYAQMRDMEHGISADVGQAGMSASKDVRWDEQGNVYQRKQLYAPEAVAKMINNSLGTSKLSGNKAIDAITKFNAAIKKAVLTTSLFHHQAFVRELWTTKLMNPMEAMRQGNEAVKAQTPEIKALVRAGMTLGANRLDYEESTFGKDKGAIEKAIDKALPEAAVKVKDKLKEMMERQTNWLFDTFGQGLKAKTALITLERQLKQNPTTNVDEIYKNVAMMMNNKFGGLNLFREHRDPTVQHIFRLFALAPDWTESNIRLMARAISGGSKMETDMYRRQWANVFAKGLGGMVAANLIMSAFDDKNVFQREAQAWKEGHLHWLDVDISPIYHLLGGKEETRKYFRLIGHYGDPIKMVSSPMTFAKHKASPLAGTIYDSLSGQDWKGQQFTSLPELLGMDDKGVYLRTTKKHQAGAPKGGQIEGQLTKRESGKGPIGYEQIPSFAAATARGMLPVPIQGLISWATGEQDGFDALTKGIGIMESSTYPTPAKLGADWTQRYLDAKQQGDNSAIFKIRQEVAKYNSKQTQDEKPTVNLQKLVLAAQKKAMMEKRYQAAAGR